MNIFRQQIPTVCVSAKHKVVHIPVCRAVSHFNWFARYDGLEIVSQKSPVHNTSVAKRLQFNL